MIKKMYIRFRVKYSLFLYILMKIQFSQQIFEKSSKIKFHGNPSIGSQVFSMWMDGRTDMTKLIVAFRNFAKAPINTARNFRNYYSFMVLMRPALNQ